MEKSLDVQVGGDHYKKLAYQPVKFSVDMCLNFIQGNIVKYVSRYKDKDGKKDLEKVLHYAQLGVELDPENFCPFHKMEDKVLEFVTANGFSDKVFDVVRATCYQNWLEVAAGTKKLYNDKD